jgi:hypothetical protein
LLRAARIFQRCHLDLHAHLVSEMIPSRRWLCETTESGGLQVAPAQSLKADETMMSDAKRFRVLAVSDKLTLVTPCDIDVLYLPPHSTDVIQPIDVAMAQGVFQTSARREGRPCSRLIR